MLASHRPMSQGDSNLLPEESVPRNGHGEPRRDRERAAIHLPRRSRMTEPLSSSPGSSPRRLPTGGFAGVQLGSIAGFKISLDYSWFILFFLILATFTGAVFPAMAPGLVRVEYLLMGAVGTVLFFSSLLTHELSHSFMARAKGIEIEGITLFVFGGMAKTSREPSTPGDEFAIAVVGPLTSFFLAAGFYAIASAAGSLNFGARVTVVAEYLGLLNLALAVFNLLPGFPLDGGRLLRATAWHLTGSLRTATRVASTAGRALGWALIGLGAYSLLIGGGLIGGLWMIFIGWFLTHAARASYQQLLLREILSPLSAGEVMSPHPEVVSPELSIDELARDFFLRRPFSSFPVIQNGWIVGLVTLGQLRRLRREDWAGRWVSDVMFPREKTVIVQPETPMAEVLVEMREGGSGRVLVAREQELLGIISASDIARWLDRIGLIE